MDSPTVITGLSERGFSAAVVFVVGTDVRTSTQWANPRQFLMYPCPFARCEHALGQLLTLDSTQRALTPQWASAGHCTPTHQTRDQLDSEQASPEIHPANKRVARGEQYRRLQVSVSVDVIQHWEDKTVVMQPCSSAARAHSHTTLICE